MNKTVGILGCGWLGKALATALKELNYKIRGSVRSDKNLNELDYSGIETFLIHLTPEKISGDFKRFLKDLDVLMISIPPNTRTNPEYDFARSIKLLLSEVEIYEVPQVLFISSTSVFEDDEKFSTYTESSEPNNKSKRASTLILAENHISNFDAVTTVIRPGGMIGDDRHPIKYLAGKNEVSNPDAPINLVHQDYLIQKLISIIESGKPPAVFNAVSEPHESRSKYYTREAQKRNLVAPQFSYTEPSKGKKIKSDINYL